MPSIINFHIHAIQHLHNILNACSRTAHTAHCTCQNQTKMHCMNMKSQSLAQKQENENKKNLHWRLNNRNSNNFIYSFSLMYIPYKFIHGCCCRRCCLWIWWIFVAHSLPIVCLSSRISHLSVVSVYMCIAYNHFK